MAVIMWSEIEIFKRYRYSSLIFFRENIINKKGMINIKRIEMVFIFTTNGKRIIKPKKVLVIKIFRNDNSFFMLNAKMVSIIEK